MYALVKKQELDIFLSLFTVRRIMVHFNFHRWNRNNDIYCCEIQERSDSIHPAVHRALVKSSAVRPKIFRINKHDNAYETVVRSVMTEDNRDAHTNSESTWMKKPNYLRMNFDEGKSSHQPVRPIAAKNELSLHRAERWGEKNRSRRAPTNVPGRTPLLPLGINKRTYSPLSALQLSGDRAAY